MIELLESQTPEAVIKVVGVGGCGGNAVDHMINNGVQGVEFITMNTDAQALKRNLAKTTLQLGKGVTKGLGAGANPEVGRLRAVSHRQVRVGAHDGLGAGEKPGCHRAAASRPRTRRCGKTLAQSLSWRLRFPATVGRLARGSTVSWHGACSSSGRQEVQRCCINPVTTYIRPTFHVPSSAGSKTSNP